MKISKIFYHVGIINHKLEFLLLIAWTLFFPGKESQVYFLGFGILACLLLFRDIYSMKTIGLSYFSHFLAIFNFILILSIFFSNYRLQSIFFFTDIFLISCYFLLFYYDRRLKVGYFHFFAYIISIFSLINIVLFFFPWEQRRHIFFISSIHEGIICGIAVLILVYYLIRNWNIVFFVLLLLNMGGVFVSQSKAAYIGTTLFILFMVVAKKKKIIPVIVLFVIMTFVIPNPIRAMFFHSIKHDPYSLDRINIWKMSIAVFWDHPITGVGLDNFQEVAKKYNFKQIHGPANYFKVPKVTHSDYIKLIAELGIFGLLIVIAVIYAIIKKTLFVQFPGIAGVLIYYLLFQALFFNILFNFFFFFIFLFLLKDIFEREQDLTFRSFSIHFKLFLTSLLACVWLIGYFFPWLSSVYIDKSKNQDNLMASFNSLKKAEFYNPINVNIHYLKALLLVDYFKNSNNLESFHSALECLAKAQRLNKNFLKAYLLEEELFNVVLGKKLIAVSLEEILSPLNRAVSIDPLNPFLRLSKARIYLKFDQKEKSREEALIALSLEPEFVSALYFLQKNFNYYKDNDLFKKKIDYLSEKARSLQLKPGSYLYKLFQLPEQNKKGRNNQ